MTEFTPDDIKELRKEYQNKLNKLRSKHSPMFAPKQASETMGHLTSKLTLLDEIERLQKYAGRLLCNEDRIWHCDSCGNDFKVIMGEHTHEFGCPVCEKLTLRPLSIVKDEKIEHLQSIVADLKADAVRLAETWVDFDTTCGDPYACRYCSKPAYRGSNDNWHCKHDPSCRIEAHRILMQKLEGEK
jgi:hypothetical protein